MNERQRIELYCLCWNDARMLPHFFRHYDDIVDHYFILDNGSTDDSLAMLAGHGRVDVSHFDVTGDSFVAEERCLSEIMWQGSKGRADWVFVVDIDEHVYHPDLRGYLRRSTELGITTLEAIGYEMVSDEFPLESAPLFEQLTSGVRSEKQDKLVIFDPDAVTRTNYEPGRHEAYPEGAIVRPAAREIQLLHYKHLGLDYLTTRSGELLEGLKQGDIERNWGIQYTWNPTEIAEHLDSLKGAALPVPGLGALRHVKRGEIDDEATLRRTGLFDDAWYLRAYPDIREAQIDPLIHYCSHGWHEGRRPNFYFDTVWYLDQNPQLAQERRNPLVHYATVGERGNQRPSEFFDPVWYRRRYRLKDGRSPLRHYLESRSGRLVSPIAGFDVAAYCVDNEMLGQDDDPFEHFVSSQE